METREKSISFVGLLVHVLKGWRSIVIWALVLMVLAGVFSYAGKPSADANSTVDSPKIENQDQIIVDKLLQQEASLAVAEEYAKNSLWFSIDPMNVYTGTLVYWVDTNYIINYNGTTKKDITSDVIAAYVQALNDDAWRNEILSQIAPDLDPQYFNELITVWPSGTSFTIQICHPDEAALRQVLEAASQAISNYSAKATEIFGDHTISLVSSSLSNTISQDIASRQQAIRDQITTLLTNVDTTKDSLTKTQKQLYYQLSQNASDLPTENLEEVAPSLDKMTLVLSAILGAFLVCLVRGLLYIFSGVVQSSDNFAEILQIPELGCIASQSSSKKLFKKLDAKIVSLDQRRLGNLTHDQQIQRITSNLQFACEQTKVSQLYLVSAGEFSEDTLQQITTKLADSSVKITQTENLFNANIKEDSAVVLTAKSGKTAYTDLAVVLNFCKSQNHPVLGLIAEI